jgi:hypothetical protein
LNEAARVHRAAWRRGLRRQRENIMRVVLAQAGHEPATAIKRAHVVAGRTEMGQA